MPTFWETVAILELTCKLKLLQLLEMEFRRIESFIGCTRKWITLMIIELCTVQLFFTHQVDTFGFLLIHLIWCKQQRIQVWACLYLISQTKWQQNDSLLCNSIKQNIGKYYKVSMFILVAFNAIRTGCDCRFNLVKSFVNSTLFRLTFSLRFKYSKLF